MPRSTDTGLDGAETIARAIAEAAEAGQRFEQAKTDLEHRLAAVDDSVVLLVQRVYEAQPPEYQRTIAVRRGGRTEEIPLPDFVRLLMEAPGGTEGTFRIDVTEDLYAADDDDEEEDDLADLMDDEDVAAD